MPTKDPQLALEAEAARERVTRSAYRTGGEERGGGVGLEPEFFVFRLDEQGRPRARLPLDGPGSVFELLDRFAAQDARIHRIATSPPSFELVQGGRLTFEPGAQLEHSTAVHATAARALDDVTATAGMLARAYGEEGAALAACGLDLWRPLAEVPQQLDAPRYRAMAAYFAARGEHGAVMMRHTASVQVNLDLGPPAVASERWRLANLAAPISTASFAASPQGGACSRRAQAWQGLDPTRTGFPARFLAEGGADPAGEYADFALDADVLLFRGEGGGAAPGRPGFPFRRWLAEGDAEHGYPTAEDLDYHLTTLFPEVRLRGFFELRCIDALPAALRPVPVVFWTTLLYEPRTRARALALLEPHRAELNDLWRDAAVAGLADRRVGELSRGAWRLVLEGLADLDADHFRAHELAAAERFVERCVTPGRAPALELLALHEASPARSLAWAREPLPPA